LKLVAHVPLGRVLARVLHINHFLLARGRVHIVDRSSCLLMYGLIANMIVLRSINICLSNLIGNPKVISSLLSDWLSLVHFD
jgi:hypothetical protein